MDELNFKVQLVNQETPDCGIFLFNTIKHFLLQDEWGWLAYVAERKGERMGVIYFHLQEGVATSPFKAPFGSFELFQNWSEQRFDEWVTFIEADLRMRGCKTIHIKNYPSAYAEETTQLVQKILTSHHFIISEETSSIIFVTKDAFESKVSISKKRKLKKSLTCLTFMHRELNCLERIYSFIAETRKVKGYQLSMDWQQIQRTVHALPQHFLLFTVEENEQLAAASICILVSETILYSFYPAHSAKYDKISPVVMLLHGIYQYASERGIEMIDLGTSQIQSEINSSLLFFKRSVGGKSVAKFSFTKNLE